MLARNTRHHTDHEGERGGNGGHDQYARVIGQVRHQVLVPCENNGRNGHSERCAELKAGIDDAACDTVMAGASTPSTAEAVSGP